ncbi:hypothetical protein ASE21_14060 [Flavobacterium sp. Root901]|uniref:hypothetical protein n=1 Tax=Flavobacterium sp. Root901 TaxID=1736605 RepID=UPI00070894AA|nr:hypothetical protein [Flavobacterium sp. Root901]KRD08971.1 hypothetical protein ASE21_14060 [Flavobacterium sp. Root901]
MKKLFSILLLLLQFSVVFAQNQPEDPSSKKIIGSWYSDVNPNIKWVFSQDGKVYNYNNDVFKVMYRYTISHSCQNNSDDNAEFITLMDKEGNEFCFKIKSINENKNGILSMVNMSNMETISFTNKK